MSDSDIGQELNKGQPLFSLQVDDVLIQQIFQKLTNQINVQSEEIKTLQSDLKNRPQMQDFLNLSEAVVSLQKQANYSSEVLETTVNNFRSSMNERSNSINQLLQTRLNEMLFSVNAAIRGELEALDKSPMPTKQTIEDVNKLKLDFSKLNQKMDDIKDTIIQMAAAYDGTISSSKLTRKTVPSCVRCTANRDRTKLNDSAEQVARLKERMDKFEETFDRILPYKDQSFPQFNNEEYVYDRNEPPSFQPLPKSITSFNDFASYVTDSIPLMQNALRGIHGFVSQIDAAIKSKVDKADFNGYQNQTQQMISFIIEETDDYKEKKKDIVMKEDFQALSNHLFDVVNGVSKSSCTNTRCIACGKIVERTADTNLYQQPQQFIKNIPPPSGQRAVIQRPGSAKSVYINETNLSDTLSIEPIHKYRSHRSARSMSSRLAPVTK